MQSGIFPDSLEDFLIGLNISGQSKRLPDNMEDFRWVGRFQMGWKISRNSGRFQDSLGYILHKYMKPERNTTMLAFTGVKSKLRKAKVLYF